ncbi:hypothetical protein PILCRDRAFT_656042 [Piloderma croceum F 1598]|uniref:Uncharacterized protein n=1 Tax=Piloderma croceum (strain F 1598) TaxID=765440 RepID=A0A0C3AQH9_PILCF|nr:hypothetical protein PILCRDRAFT_656042 [Piloderma croceum F 1598]
MDGIYDGGEMKKGLQDDFKGRCDGIPDCTPQQHEDAVNGCVQRAKESLSAEWLPEERRDKVIIECQSMTITKSLLTGCWNMLSILHTGKRPLSYRSSERSSSALLMVGVSMADAIRTSRPFHELH